MKKKRKIKQKEKEARRTWKKRFVKKKEDSKTVSPNSHSRRKCTELNLYTCKL